MNLATWAHVAEARWDVPALALALYGALLVHARWRPRAPAAGASPGLVAWNGALALCSALGVGLTAPTLARHARWGAHHAVCASAEETYACGAPGVAIGAFTASKLVELGDTVWLVARGRPVRFLHWYHHASVLAFCWLALARRTGMVGLWFGTINMAVHAVMYAYYAFQAQARGAPRWVRRCARAITLLQICQMVAGAALVAAAGAFMLSGVPCALDPHVAGAGALMYTSYGVLFVRFYRAAYPRATGPRDVHPVDKTL